MSRHKKMTFIECAYWCCPFQTVKFNDKKPSEFHCFDKEKGLLYLGDTSGKNAPKWCQKRKENGGLL